MATPMLGRQDIPRGQGTVNLLDMLRLLFRRPGVDETRVHTLPSGPLPQRLSATDTNAWVEPTPASSDNYLTFWAGNQLPGSYMHVTPHTAWVEVSSQSDLTPQFNGQFGPVMGQLQSAQLVARWRSLWQQAQGAY